MTAADALDEPPQGRRTDRDVTLKPGWLARRLAASVAAYNRLPAELREMLRQTPGTGAYVADQNIKRLRREGQS